MAKITVNPLTTQNTVPTITGTAVFDRFDNLGNPKEFTILELAENIISKVDTKSRLINLALPSDDPKQRKPDISLANELLEWSPKINLDMGLDLTIKYFTEILKA